MGSVAPGHRMRGEGPQMVARSGDDGGWVLLEGVTRLRHSRPGWTRYGEKRYAELGTLLPTAR